MRSKRALESIDQYLDKSKFETMFPKSEHQKAQVKQWLGKNKVEHLWQKRALETLSETVRRQEQNRTCFQKVSIRKPK